MAASRGIDWDAQPLGSMPDMRLAAALGVGGGVVGYHRRRLGIRPFGAPRLAYRIDWRSQPLGEMSDVDLARRIGCPKSTVRWARSRRGIPAFTIDRGIDWDSLPLGKVSDSAVAKRYDGVDAKMVARRRVERSIPVFGNFGAKGVDWDNQPLGKEPDSAIAARVGVDVASVRKARNARGVPAWVKYIPWDSLPLGLEFDSVIADSIGVDTGQVCAARIWRGIKKHTERRNCAVCGEPFETSRVLQVNCGMQCSHVLANHRKYGRPNVTLSVVGRIALLRREINQRRKDNVEND